MCTTNRSPRPSTVVAQACANVAGFSDLFKRLKRRMKASGRSESTLNNYAPHLAQMALHFNTLYSAFALFSGWKDWITNESLCQPFNEKINFRWYSIPDSDRYTGSLWSSLFGNTSLQLKDIDLNRRMLHIWYSKAKKDRYVSIGSVLAAGLQKYIEAERPYTWLFNGVGDPAIEGRKGGDFYSRYYQRGVQWAVTQAIKHAGIKIIRRFALHILPKGFVGIRHYGILSNAVKQTTLASIREQLTPEQHHVQKEELTSELSVPLEAICSCCKKGGMQLVMDFDHRGLSIKLVSQLTSIEKSTLWKRFAKLAREPYIHHLWKTSKIVSK